MVCVVQTYDPPHPTYPLVREVTAGSDGGVTGTSHTVNLPSGIGSGERLIVLFAAREDSGNVTFPAGYTPLFDGGNSGQTVCVGAYRDCDGTEGASIVVTTGTSRACSWHVWRLSRGNFIAGVAPEVGTVASGSSSTPDAPNVAPSWGAQNILVIVMVTFKKSASPPTVSSYPTNYTNNQTYTAGANNKGLISCSRQLSASSENPGTLTLSASEQWSAQTIAVRIAS